MARSDGRVEAGQSLKTAISATAWNRAQDAADIVLSARPSLAAGEALQPYFPYTWVMGQNRTGSPVERWGVLKIAGVEIVPGYEGTRAQAQFEEMPVMRCESASFGDTSWGIAVRPVGDEGLTRLAVGGVVVCQVNVKQLDDTMVRVAYEGGKLETCKTGEAMILWKEEARGDDRWALIRLGTGLGGMRLGKTAEGWAKGATQEIDLYFNRTLVSPSERVEAINTFADVDPGRWVMVAREDGGDWYLISAEC